MWAASLHSSFVAVKQTALLQKEQIIIKKRLKQLKWEGKITKKNNIPQLTQLC